MEQSLSDGRRIAVADLAKGKSGVLAGLITCERQTWILRESSGHWPLPLELCAQLDGSCDYWGVIKGVPDQPEWVQLMPKQQTPSVAPLMKGFRLHQKRFALHCEIEQFFRERHFVKVDTPAWVLNPGMEPYLDTFAVGDGWLRTSPELHMKRLLAAGHDRLFQVAPCFRKGDRGRWHREEFLMLEWYRLFAGLDELIEDLRQLLPCLASLSAEPDYWKRDLEVIRVVDLFERELGIRLRDCQDREPLRKALLDRGFDGFDQDDDWDTLFHLAFLNFIEPKLGFGHPVIVRDYPASQAALARLGQPEPDVMPHCLRFELFAKGIELANAFDELTDASEQRARHEADRKVRRELGKPVYAQDEAFLQALASGLPPAAGIALGIDRLVALILGANSLDDILPFGDIHQSFS